MANAEDIPKGKKRCFSVGDKSVIICRVYDKVFAVKNLCPHLNQPLADGRLMEYELTCPYHNATFDIRNGKVVTGPSVWPVETYQCKIENGDIYIKACEKTEPSKPKDPRL